MDNRAATKHYDEPAQKGGFFDLRTKMLLGFGLLFAITLMSMALAEIYGIPYTGFGGEYEEHRSEVFRNLNLVADLKKERLLRWIEERRDDATVLAESSIIGSSISKLRKVVEEDASRGKQGSQLWTEVRQNQLYRSLVQHLTLTMKTYDVYEKIQIADAATGTIIVSTVKDEIGIDVSQEAYFRGALDCDGSFINIGKESGDKEFGLHVTHVIKTDDSRSGDDKTAVLIMHVYPDDFIKPMLHTSEGLGETGEALLVNQEVKILTSLKHPLADGTIARPLEYQIKAKPAQLAAGGEEGITEAEDYRGEPVLAAFRHIRITPELGWGMVVKEDRAEVFAPLYQSMSHTLFVGLVGVLIVLVLASVLATRLSRPIHLLSETAREVARGDLDARAPTSGSSEIATLAKTFNSMIERVQRWHVELEEQVATRTAELNEANKSFRSEISERKRVEEQLERTLADLKRSNEELQQFASVASHDLQEPLRMVASYTQLLEKRYKDALDADAKEFIQFAVDGATRMQRLIDDLLAYSRVGSRNKPFEPTDCQAVLEQAIDDLGIAIEETDAVITHDELPTVLADEFQLEQLFQNLIGNAIKFRSSQAPRIHVSARQEADEWVFSVRDNGIGIDPLYNDKILEIFQRLHGRDKYPGTGIGLAICKRIAERHGGRIWVDSEVDKGSIFYFTIPVMGDDNHG